MDLHNPQLGQFATLEIFQRLEAIPSCIQALKQSLSLQSLSLVSNDLMEEGLILFADHMSSFGPQFIRLIFGTKRRFQHMPKPLVIDIELIIYGLDTFM